MASNRATNRGEVLQREIRAVQLYTDGLTYEQVGREIGCSASRACHIVTRALKRSHSDAVEDLRRLHLAQLREAMAECRRQMRLDHVMVSQGVVVANVVDEGAKLKAIETLVAVQARMCRLLGMDAPTRHQVLTDDALLDEIARLEAELESEGAPPAPAEDAPAQD